nr:MAG TPA: hypothetical protein [Caudoviricetes sp.]
MTGASTCSSPQSESLTVPTAAWRSISFGERNTDE